jgi:HemY protein
MIRIILLFLLIAGAVWLAVWLADHPGRVEIEMMGYAVYTEQVGLLIGAVVLLTAVVAVLYRIWRSLRRAPRRIGSVGIRH